MFLTSHEPIPAALAGQCDKDWSSYVKVGKAGIRMSFMTILLVLHACIVRRIATRCDGVLANGSMYLASDGGITGERMRR
jgi:hypothetical protein